MEEKIKKIQRYLLNPKEAIKDRFSFFGSLHDILKLEQQEAHSKYNEEVYQLYWAIFAFFLEPYETERQCCCVPIENGKKKWNEAKIIHTIYLDRNGREIENKSNPITEEEWDNLQFTGEVLGRIESVPDINTGEILKIKKGYREERESNDYTLEFQYKFHFYADEALGFNLHSLSPANYNDLKTDRHTYLENGFYSGAANIHRERHFLWQDFKDCHIRWDNLNPKEEQEYTPLKQICNTYDKIKFIHKTEVDYSEYIERIKKTLGFVVLKRLYSEEATKKWFDELTKESYLHGSFSDFDALANKFDPTNKIIWIKQSTKRNGKAISALIDLLQILDYGYIRAPLSIGKNMTDERKEIKDAAKKYFDLSLTASYFDNPQSLYYEELNNIITK